MVPQFIIVNAYQPISDFKQFAFAHGENEAFVWAVVELLIGTLIHRTYADYQIREFAAQVELSEYDNQDSTIWIKPIFAQPILQLGFALFEEIQSMGIYTSSGDLLFELAEENPMAFRDVILKNIAAV